MIAEIANKQCNIIGLDIAKNVFQVCVQDYKGNILIEKQLRRNQVLTWFSNQELSKVGIEACGGSHYWARELSKQGHAISVIPAQYVKPFLMGNKNDKEDAKAIAKALREPSISSIGIASKEDQEHQALHRIRQRLIKERTRLVNQTRALLMELGIVIPKGRTSFFKGVNDLLLGYLEGKASISSSTKLILENQLEEFKYKDKKIDLYTEKIRTYVQNNKETKVLLEIPGVGPLSASSLYLKLKTNHYESSRHFSSSLGLVPSHEGTGGKVRMGGISKRGDKNLRCLLIHGARSILRFKERRQDKLGVWLKLLVERRGIHKACVALANKNARIAYRLFSKKEIYDPNKVCKTLFKKDTLIKST